MTVLGISSPLHTWNPSSERFIRGTGSNRIRNPIIVDGKCEILTSRQGFLFLFGFVPKLTKCWNSIIARFLTIGTLLRRLESLLMTLRSRSAFWSLTLNIDVLPSFLGQRKKAPLSMLSHILSPLYLFTSGMPLLSVHLLMLK